MYVNQALSECHEAEKKRLSAALEREKEQSVSDLSQLRQELGLEAQRVEAAWKIKHGMLLRFQNCMCVLILLGVVFEFIWSSPSLPSFSLPPFSLTHSLIHSFTHSLTHSLTTAARELSALQDKHTDTIALALSDAAKLFR